MDVQSSDARVTGSGRWSLGRRLRTGAVGVIAVGGALVMAGAVSVVPVSAHYVSTTTAGAGTNANGSDFVAGATQLVGTQIMDSATLASYTIDPARSVVFSLYAPKDATCLGTPLKTFTDTPTGVRGAPFAGPVYGGPYTTTMVGTYHWTARVMYSGKTESGPTNCADEPELITPASPRINTTPTAGGTVGISIGDTATVSGGVNPTGTVTFNLYGPGNVSCTATALYTSAVPLSAAGNAASGMYTTLAVGTYSWTAKYSGDLNNRPASSGCEAETVTTTVTMPAISTLPSAGGTIGVSLSDTATVTGGSSPTGTVTFSLFAPSNATCSASGTAAVYTSGAVSLSAGTASSGSFTTTAATGAGTYHWIAAYSGDAHNSSVISPCTAEAVVVTNPSGIQPITPGGVLAITTGAIPTPTTGGTGGFGPAILLLLAGLGVIAGGSALPRRRSIW